MEEPALPACAFVGFRLLARRPLMLLTWWLAMLAVGSLVFGGALLLGHPDRPGGFVIHLTGPVGVPMLMLAATVMVCAVFRELLQPEHRLVGLRLGADELRLAPVVLGLGAVLGAGMSPLLLPGRVELATTAALLLISPFVCLIAPAIFATRWRTPMAGWRIAKGRYFDLLGMNLLTWGVYATLSVLLGQLWKWLIVLNDAAIQRALHGGSSAVGWLVAPAVVLAVLVYGALLVIVTAPSAEAYRRLTSPPAPGP